MITRRFERFGGMMAILAGFAGFLYAVSFMLLKSPLLSSLFLMLTGLAATAALVALYYRVRQVDMPFAVWALGVGLMGAAGSAIHGGYDLANNAQSTLPPPEVMALPSQIDPRGLLTFGLAGVALFVFSWMIAHSRDFPRPLGYLGYLSALLLVTLYLGRLIVLEPTNPIILIPVLLTGFILNPIWYIWLGFVLWQHAATAPSYSGVERRMTERRQSSIG
jgi:hypothetical protein